MTFIFVVSVQTLHGGSATWNANPGSGDWHTAVNWTPATVPNGPASTATFTISVTTGISLPANTEVNGIVFANNNFTITAAPAVTLTLSGAGITNNSGTTQTFVTTVDGAGSFGQMNFTNSATAGVNTAFTCNGAIVSGVFGGGTQFFNTSTAGNGTFTNNGGAVSGGRGGATVFRANSTAANGTFTNNGGMISGAFGGTTEFHSNSTASSGAFTNNGGTVSGQNNGGYMYFADTSNAGSATLIANGGTGGGNGGAINFFNASIGGTARVEVFGNGNLDISQHDAPGVTIGSIEGSGNVFVGARNLTVGSNNLSTTFSGAILDGGGGGGTGGSLTKIGSGTLTFQGGATNNYIADTVGLSLVSGSIINLNFSGAPDTIRSLIVDGVAQPAGVYGSAASGAPNQLAQFAGTGQVQVGVVVLPVITSPPVMTGTVGLPFTYQFTASGATLLEIPGSIAPGLTFNSSVGAITGKPTTAGVFQVGLSATNSAGTTPGTLTITVQPAPAGLAIVSSTCATGRTGRAFSFQLQAIGGSSATRFAVDGFLPPGLNLDSSTGFISGTPTSDGSFGLAVSAIDGVATTNATLQLTFTSDPTVPIITSERTATLTPGLPFSYTITADANGTFGYIGSDGIVHQAPSPSCAGLPAGLCFDGINKISGTFNPPFGSDRGSPTRPNQTGGIITNVQLFAANPPNGASIIPLFPLRTATGAQNIATRLAVDTGDNALIGGFIINESFPGSGGPKKVVIRARGPFLTQVGVPNALADPVLELNAQAGPLSSNDNWRDNQGQATQIIATGLQPSDDREAAILAYLNPGLYTAVVRGKNNSTGNAIVEVYDLGTVLVADASNSRLANISTRGTVLTGDNRMFGGFIIGPVDTRVIVRAIGPSLSAFVSGALQDPTLELKNENGSSLIGNDDWESDPMQAAEIQQRLLAPTNPRESALVTTLQPGQYTAIVSGKGGTTGVALVEGYVLPNP